MKFADTAQTLVTNSYAPAPIPKGAKMPPGPWSVFQVPYMEQDQGDADAALLLGLRGAQGYGRTVVEHPEATWLATLTVTVKPALVAGVDAIVAKHVGSGPLLELDDGTTVRLFKQVGYPSDPIRTEPYLLPDVATVETFGFLSLAAGKWRNGSPVTVPRAELPALDRETAKAILREVNEFLAANAPPAPAPVRRPAPPPVRLPPLAKLKWSDTDALEHLTNSGYSVCRVEPNGVGLNIAAPAIRRARRGEGFTANATGLVAVSVKSRLPEVWELIETNFGRVPVREASDGTRLHVFRAEYPFKTVEENRFDPDHVRATMVRVRVESFAGVIALTGKDEAGKLYRWLDGPTVLDTPRAELPAFNDGHAQQLLADIGRLIGQRSRAA